MPTFDFTSPEGKTYSVEGPEGATQEQAFQILQTQLGKPAESGPGIGEDLASVAKAAPGRIVAGLAGIPGDLLHLGMRALGDNLTPESNYGSSAIARSLGSDYEAKTEPGRIAQKTADFLPALIGGPETLGVKALTRVAAPVAASEAGRAVGGPVGEVAGALAGATGASSIANRFNSAVKGAVPTVDELKNAARAGYKSSDVEAVRINPQAVDNLAGKIENDLVGQGFRPKGQAGVFDIVDELRGAPGAVNVADLDAARKALGVIAKEKDAVGQATANSTAARSAIKHIDDFLPNLSQADLLAGDAAKANRILEEARQNWAAAKRAEQVQTLRANAELNAAAANSGQNIQNATKQAFKPLIKNNYAKAVGYNAEERAALNRVVRGDMMGSAARFAGNLLGGGGGLGMLAGAGAGYAAGGPEGAITAALAGKGLKAIGNRATFNAVNNLDRLLRSRSPAALKLAAQLPPQVVAKLPKKSAAILAAMSARSVIAPQPVPHGDQ